MQSEEEDKKKKINKSVPAKLMDVNRVSDLCQFCASTMNLLVQISRSLNYHFKLKFYLNYLRFSFKLILQQIYNLMGRFFSTTFFLINSYMLWKDIILKKIIFVKTKCWPRIFRLWKRIDEKGFPEIRYMICLSLNQDVLAVRKVSL